MSAIAANNENPGVGVEIATVVQMHDIDTWSSNVPRLHCLQIAGVSSGEVEKGEKGEKQAID